VTAQSIAVGFTVLAVCALAGYVLFLHQGRRHSDDRAALLREHLDTLRALHVPEQEQEQEDDPEWWNWQFDGIAAGFSDDEGEGS
jgi:hypothetical protein